jgi:uncharacterized protein (DUF1697 family)
MKRPADRRPGSGAAHVALLRGINVGGKNKVPMADLSEVFEEAGCTSVRTYIQSGNVVFEAPRGGAGKLAAALAARIARRFGFEVPVVLRTADELEQVVRGNPFLEGGTAAEALHVAFLADRPTPAGVARLDAGRSPPDSFRVVGSEIYLHLPNGVARSKLTNAYFDSRLSTTTTVRNWRTVLKLLEVAGAAALLAFAVVFTASCSRFGPVYPSRPAASAGAPVSDPEPAKVVLHVAVSRRGLAAAIDDAAPRSGEGTFPLLGSDRHYAWERGPFEVAFGQGRVVLSTTAKVEIALPLKPAHVSLGLRIQGEPVVSAEYAVRLQSVEVSVTSTDASVQIADRVAGVYEKIEAPILTRLKELVVDLRPLLSEAYARVSRPIGFPLGEATGCARLRVLEIEAAPTVLADGIEKDLAIVVAPSISLPCADTVDDGSVARLPPLSNVAALTAGPFTLTVPIAARYDELTRAMAAAFTDGRLYFSPEYPGLYLEKPEVYEADTQLVLKLHIHGPVHKLGIDADLDGDLYLVGHPSVADNELAVPDLEPTIETRSFLLSIKAMTDADRIRDEARRALRLDLGARLRSITSTLGPDLTFRVDSGCIKGDVDRVVVTGVHPHADYLRLYVSVTARARATLPCDE